MGDRDNPSSQFQYGIIQGPTSWSTYTDKEERRPKDHSGISEIA